MKPSWKVKGFCNRTSWKVFGRGESNQTIRSLIPAKVILQTAETEQLHQVQRMIGGIRNMLFSIYSQTENV